jgi:hypothetical protein
VKDDRNVHVSQCVDAPAERIRFSLMLMSNVIVQRKGHVVDHDHQIGDRQTRQDQVGRRTHLLPVVQRLMVEAKGEAKVVKRG